MKQELKAIILNRIKNLTEGDIVHEAVYKCVNDGMVCFNGMVAELVNGCKYEPDNFRSGIEDRLWQDAYDQEQEYAIEDKRKELENIGLNNKEISMVINSLLDRGIFDDIEPEVNYEDADSALTDEIAEQITGDLTDIYESNSTRSLIDDVHVAYCNNQIDFDRAVAEVEEIITNQE